MKNNSHVVKKKILSQEFERRKPEKPQRKVDIFTGNLQQRNPSIIKNYSCYADTKLTAPTRLVGSFVFWGEGALFSLLKDVQN